MVRLSSFEGLVPVLSMFVLFSSSSVFADTRQPAPAPASYPTPSGTSELVFVEKNGIAMMEIESSPQKHSNWEEQTSTGRTHLTWKGEVNLDPARIKNEQLLVYRVRISTPGVYEIRLNNHYTHPDGDATRNNDVFIGIDQTLGSRSPASRIGWYKAWTHKINRWNWDTTFGIRVRNNGHKEGRPYMAKNYFNVGHHSIMIAPRSPDFTLDKIALVHHCRAKDKLDGLPQSVRQRLVEKKVARKWNRSRDLVSLHYDHCADNDDLQSIAADHTLINELDIPMSSVLIVSGTVGHQKFYGQDDYPYNFKESTIVNDRAWGKGNWIEAYHKEAEAVRKIYEAWRLALTKGGDIWVKEGGQSDVTALVVKRVRGNMPNIDTTKRIHVIQHGVLNEFATTSERPRLYKPAKMPEWKHMPLLYVWKNTDYVRIEDGNHMNASADLNTKDPSRVSWFKRVAARSKHRGVWETAFDQYKRTKFYPNDRTVDFSDTVEFLYILEIPKSVVRDEKDFANRYLK